MIEVKYDENIYRNDENIYRKLPQNNIKSLQRKVNGTLLDMKKKKEIFLSRRIRKIVL